MNKNYYIKEIRDLSKNYDSETQSKILDDLTGSVVLLERSNNYAVVKTHIHDYEIMTVECFLSDLEVA